MRLRNFTNNMTVINNEFMWALLHKMYSKVWVCTCKYNANYLHHTCICITIKRCIKEMNIIFTYNTPKTSENISEHWNKRTYITKISVCHCQKYTYYLFMSCIAWYTMYDKHDIKLNQDQFLTQNFSSWGYATYTYNQQLKRSDCVFTCWC